MIWYIVIGLNAIAIIAFFVLIFVYRRKFAGVKHYEDIRDELTVRKKKESATDEGISGFFNNISLGSLIGGFVVIIVGVNIIGTVATQVEQAKQTANVTSTLTPATDTILGLVPIFFAIGVMVAGVTCAIGGLSNRGLK